MPTPRHDTGVLGPTDLTINELVRRHARTRPDDLAVAFPEERLTFAELDAAVGGAAAFLAGRGVQVGDHVGIFLPTACADYLVVALGAMRIGAVAVCLNSRFKTRELTYALQHSACRVVVSDSPLRELAEQCTDGSTEVVDVRTVRQAWWSADGTGPVEDAFDPDAPARIIYTSGTTSMPKACVHTHRAMAHQGWAVASRLELEPQDRFWAPLALFHTGGWTPFLAAQAAGASYHHPGHFTADVAVRQIAGDRCTVLFPGFETIWMQVLSHPEFSPAAFDAARLVINVGVPERLRIMQELLPGAPQISNTGCTEVGGFLCLGKASDSEDSRFHTSGQLLEGMEARIIDPITGLGQPDGLPGELVVRGPACLLEYHDDPEGTASAVRDGWFHTGDLLRRTPEGELVFISRLKDMLKVGGENVAALEIEDHLLMHPAIRLVAVVAAPDDHYGEVPVAFVELEAGQSASEKEIIDFCRGSIASFKVPRHVRFLADWPMSGTKIRKVELREQIAKDLHRTR